MLYVAQSTGDGYYKGMPPPEDIWGNFQQKDFSTLSKSGQTAHLLNAIRYSKKYGDGTVNVNRIFSNFSRHTSFSSQGFSSGLANVKIGSRSFEVYLDFSIYANINGQYNSNIDFGGGTTVNRTISGNPWTFYKNSGYQFGTHNRDFDYLYNWLGY